MKYTTIILFFICCLQVNGQKDSCEVILDKVEKLQSLSRLNEADSLLRLVDKQICVEPKESIEDKIIFYKAKSFYLHKEYESALDIFKSILNKQDSLTQYNYDDYIKNAYYIANCYHKLNKDEDSEEIIKETLLKCISSWGSCSYSMRMYNLLIDIYSHQEGSQHTVEQLHNERQIFAINLYDYRNHTKESNKILKDFLEIHKMYKNRESKDSVYYRSILIKARILSEIADYEEAKTCYNKANDYLNANVAIANWIEEKKQVLYESIWNSAYLEDHKKVIELCDEYEKLDDSQETDQRYIVYYNHGVALFGLHNYNLAIPLLNKTYSYLTSQSSTLIPLFVMTAYYLGICYYRTNNYKESIKYATEGINCYQKRGDKNLEYITYLYDVLGAAYLKTNDYSNAMLYLKKSAELQLVMNGFVDEKTNSKINECKIQIK